MLITDPADIPGEPKNRHEALNNLLDKNDFLLSAGRYYVDGMLCENPGVIGYSEQLTHALKADTQYLVFLDVWERHITHWEDRQLECRSPPPRHPRGRSGRSRHHDTYTG